MTEPERDIRPLEPEPTGASQSVQAREATPIAPAATPMQSMLSILIVSHETGQELEDCLVSIEQQRDSLQLEVIVVDNASRDGTVESVQLGFPWVRVVRNSENVGFARAVNQAMALAHGDYFLLLNPDTVVNNGALAGAIQQLTDAPEIGMLGCKLVRPDGSFDHACKRGFPTISTAVFYFLGLARLMPHSARFAHYTAGSLDQDETGLVDAINGAFMLVRREAVEDVGEMDERFWLYAEDLDWCHRFWERGWKVMYWPEAEVIHIKGASAGDHRSPRLNYAFHHSIWLFYEKYHAPKHGRLTTGLVYTGIWAKYSWSVAWSSCRAVAGKVLGKRPASRR